MKTLSLQSMIKGIPRRSWKVAATLLVTATSLVSSAKAEDAYWRTRPGGLASISYQLPAEPRTDKQTGYYNIDFPMIILKDPGNSLSRYDVPAGIKGQEDKLGYYWAHQFAFVGGASSGVDGYMGLQTIGIVHKADPQYRQDPNKNIFVKNARIAIFSIWDALDGRPGPGGYAAPYGHEGSGWSCKVEYDFVEGHTYILRIFELSDAQKPNEPEWWRGSVIDQNSGKETVIGDIQVKAGFGWLTSKPSMFTEYYTQIVNQATGDADDGKANPRVCNAMPRAEVAVLPPMANNRTVNATSMTVNNYGKCANASSWKLFGKSRTLSSGETVTEPVHNITGSLTPVR